MVCIVRWTHAALAGAALVAALAAARPQADGALLPVEYEITLKGQRTLVDGTTIAVRESGTLSWSVSAIAFSFETLPHQPSLFFVTRGAGSLGVRGRRLTGLSSFWIGQQTTPPPPPEEVAGRMILRARLSKDQHAFRGRWTAAIPVGNGVEHFEGRIEGRRIPAVETAR